MPTTPYDLIIAGGGAAGFFGALAFLEARPSAHALLLERGRALLGKVKISGGGRCNVTHAQFDPARLVESYPRGGKELRGPFTRFQPRDTVIWFERRGVRLKTEPDGRMFPVTDQSQTIIDCFLDEAGRAGLEIITQAPVERIATAPEGFTVRCRSGEEYLARRVLLATGGETGGFALAASLGHTIVPPVPSLFTFALSDLRLAGLAGVSVAEVHLRLEVGGRHFEQRGPLLVTHWGLSGPAVLKLSAWAARELSAAGYSAALRINFQPGRNTDQVIQSLLAYKERFPGLPAGGRDPDGRIPARLWQRLVEAAGIPAVLTWRDCAKNRLARLAEEISAGKYQVQGKGQFKEEFVTCGGVSLREVHFKTMESKIVPGLYLAGEVLDIDGVTGGFNFQSAWTTGWIAGMSAAQNAG